MPTGLNAGIGGLNINVGVNLSAFNQGMDQIDRRAQQSVSNINRMGQALTTGVGIGAGFAVASAGIQAVSSAAQAAGAAIIGLNSQLEQARIGFTAFTGSVEKSNAFIKQLQQFAQTTSFEFPTLLQMSRALTGMGIAAEAVIPMLKSVGAVVMSMGGGEVEIKRVNRALTQMIATGRVQADEMNQLAEAGIPAWDMLAKSMGKSIGEVRQLSKQGMISAQDMLQAFKDFETNNNLDSVLQQASKTWAVATTNIIDGLRNMGAEGFEPIFNLARDAAVAISEMFQTDMAQQFTADLKASMQELVNMTRPVQDAFARIFDAFKTSGPSGAFNQILEEVQSLAEQMFGAGVNVVTTFASGIMEGGVSLIQSAANFIADTIASYLIGSSPPPQGPLSQIVQGGTAVMEAYVEGLMAGTGGVSAVAQEVADKLRTIDEQIRNNSSALQDYRNAAADIRDAHEQAIEPLQRQLELLREGSSLQEKQADIQDKLRNAELRQQLLRAQGDPVRRAELQGQLDALEMQEKDLSLQERALSIQQQGRTGKDRDKGIETQRQALAQRRLQIDIQQHNLQQQMHGMVDKEAVARIKAAQAAHQQASEQRNISEEIGRLNRELEAAPIEQQIKDIKAQQQALIKPIEERIKHAEREGQALQRQRQEWQALSTVIRETTAETKKQAAEAAKAAKAAALGEQTDVAGVFGTKKIEDVATKVGQEFITKFTDKIKSVGPQLIGGAIGGMLGASLFGPLGLAAGAIFGAQFVTRMQEHFGSLENLGGLLAGKISDALNIDTAGANNSIEAFAIIFETMRDRAVVALNDLRNQAVTSISGLQAGLESARETIAGVFGEGASTSFVDGLNKSLEALKRLLQGDMPGAASAFSGSLNDMSQAASQLNANIQPLLPVLAGLGTALVAFRVISTVVAGVLALNAAITASGGVIAAIVAALGGPLTLAIAAVAAIIGVLTVAWIQNWGDIQGITATGIQNIQAGYQTMSEFISTSYTTITEATIAAWTTIQTTWNTGVQAVINIGMTLWNTLTPENQRRIQELLALMQELWSLLPSVWTAGTQAIMQTVTQWWTSLVAIFTSQWQVIQSITQTALGTIAALFPTIYEGINLATGGFFDNMRKLWEGAQQLFPAMATTLGETIMSALTAALNAGVQVVVDTVTGAVRRAIESAKSLIGQFSATGGGSGGSTLMSWNGGATGSRADPELERIINDAARRYALPARLFMAQLQHESANFDPRVISGARTGGSGELGLGQFMPGTLKSMLEKNGISLEQYLGNARIQVEIAAQHMAELNQTFGDYDKALQAYNGGPGGVGSAATQRYNNIVRQVADTLKGSEVMTMSNAMNTGRMTMGVSQITAGREAGLSNAESQAICGPYAAVLFAQATGRNPNLAEAKELAAAVGWTAQAGMGGTGNFMTMLGRMGINAVRQQATPENINAALAAGRPIALSTPRHYFVGSGGNASGINVGATGTVMGGSGVMSLQEITALGGGMNDLIVLMDQVQTKGTESFQTIKREIGQFGLVTEQSANTATTALTNNANAASSAGQVIQAQTQTLATSISQGLVPAGLAARDAVGAMAIGIQPLIAQFANGQINAEQLGTEMVKLASSTGLNVQPLQQLEAGNVSVGAALKQVLSSLSQADPAFQEIETSINQTGDSTAVLADTMLRGLMNVTGQVPTALTQIAASAQPLMQAFQSGAISGEQFVASVVELGATSGLTQVPLQAMSDGVMSANRALLETVEAAAGADPAVAGLADSITNAQGPATDAAQSFLEYVTSLQEAPAAAQEAATGIEQVPQAMVDMQQPVQDAATQTFEAIPQAATPALQTTVDEIRNTVGPATEAATEVGNAIVEGIRSAVEAGAESIAEAAKKIVEKALSEAKKAAEAVKEGSGSDEDDSEGEERRYGGRLTPGVWTLVGEEGPELISPTGYVYTAKETAQMAIDKANAGLTQIRAFAKGGQSNLYGATQAFRISARNDDDDDDSSSRTPAKEVDPTEPGRQRTNPYREEYDLQQKILELTQQKNKLELQRLPLVQELAAAEEAQRQAAEGTFDQKVHQSNLNKQDLALQMKIWELQNTPIQPANTASPFNARPEGGASLLDLQQKLGNLEREQDAARKGSIQDRLLIVHYSALLAQNEAKIAELVVQQLPAKERLQRAEESIAGALRGTLEQQLELAAIGVNLADLAAQRAQVEMEALPLRQRHSRIEREQAKIRKGTLEQQLQMNAMSSYQNKLSLQENELQQKAVPLRHEIAKIEREIERIQRGSIAQQQQLARIASDRARLELQIAEEELQAVPIRNEIARIEREIEETIRGSAEDRAIIRANSAEILYLRGEELRIQSELLPVNSEIRRVQAEIESIHRGTLAQQLQSVDTSAALATLRIEELGIQGQLRDVESGKLILSQDQINALHERLENLNYERDKIQDNSELERLKAELASVDAQKHLIKLQDQQRTQQEQLDLLGDQSAVLENQNEQINVQNEIASIGMQEQLEALQEQLRGHEANIAEMQAQTDLLNAQEGLIRAATNLDAVGAREKLEALRTQLEEYDAQIGAVQEQNEIIGLQLDNVRLTNEERAIALEEEKIKLNAQLEVYDDMIASIDEQTATYQAQQTVINAVNAARAATYQAEKVIAQSMVDMYQTQIDKIVTQNDRIGSQKGLIEANNNAAAAGYAGQIASINFIVERREGEIQQLINQQQQIDAQNRLINIQKQQSAAMHDYNVLKLTEQLTSQDRILSNLNNQITQLEAQRRIYQDIRDLADAIANRPPGASPAPPTSAPISSPVTSPNPGIVVPQRVVAIATGPGRPSLSLRTGTGVDGWYNDSLHLIVQGNNVAVLQQRDPGYNNIRWLAEGGLWPEGSVAVVGEDGPEIAVAARDMMVFPHEQSRHIARAFGKATPMSVGGPGDTSERPVTVNVEYHRHGGAEYGEASLQQVIREAVAIALRQ